MQSAHKPSAPGPHDEFELSAYDRVSSPPPEQVVKGMAEKEGLGGVSPKVFPEVKEETGVPESLQTVDFATYIGKVVSAAAGNYKQLAIDHKDFFEKTIAESDDINKDYFESLKKSQKDFFAKQAEAFKAFDTKLDTMTRLTQVVIKLTRGEGAKPSAPAPEFDREAIEAAAYNKGFKQAKANDVKARKSMATQIRNLRLQLQEKEHQPPDEDIVSVSDGPEEGAAESAEEYRERKEREKEREREKKAEAREEHKDGEWDPRFKPITIPPKKRSRMNSPVPLAPSSSSSSSSAFSSSSAAGAGAFHAPGAPKKKKIKVYCEECQADKEEACVCEEEE
jgi:hypothetical protein